MGQSDDVVRPVPVLLRAVAVIRPHHRYPASGRHCRMHLLEEQGDRLLTWQMLEKIGDEYPVEVVLGQLGLLDLRGDPPHTGGVVGLGVGDLVDRNTLLGGYRLDELPPPRGGVEDTTRVPHQAVYMGSDLVPDGGAGTLVDVAEPVCVEALVVQGDLLLGRLRKRSKIPSRRSAGPCRSTPS